jgi:hypothetical protein
LVVAIIAVVTALVVDIASICSFCSLLILLKTSFINPIITSAAPFAPRLVDENTFEIAADIDEEAEDNDGKTLAETDARAEEEYVTPAEAVLLVEISITRFDRAFCALSRADFFGMIKIVIY